VENKYIGSYTDPSYELGWRQVHRPTSYWLANSHRELGQLGRITFTSHELQLNWTGRRRSHKIYTKPNASNANSSHSLTKSSQPPNLSICITSV